MRTPRSGLALFTAFTALLLCLAWVPLSLASTCAAHEVPRPCCASASAAAAMPECCRDAGRTAGSPQAAHAAVHAAETERADCLPLSCLDGPGPATLPLAAPVLVGCLAALNLPAAVEGLPSLPAPVPLRPPQSA